MNMDTSRRVARIWKRGGLFWKSEKCANHLDSNFHWPWISFRPVVQNLRRNVLESSEIQRFFPPKIRWSPKKKKKKKKKKVFAKIQSDFSAEIQNSKVFSAQNKVISKKKKKKVFAKIQSDFSAEIQNSNVFSAQNKVISKKKKKKKKKKRSSPKFRAIFLPISQLQTFEGGLFSYGGGYFPFFTQNRPQKHKIHAFLHTSQANGGGSSPPWLRYWIPVLKTFIA